jgi:hypothetical protein
MSRTPDQVAPADTLAEVRDLLDVVTEVYRDSPAAVSRADALRGRLDRPLHVALVGRVKAGKSTLLNALVGEHLAPTDAGECTRVVTRYRHGTYPRVVLHRSDGSRRVLPVRRSGGALRLDLGGAGVDEVVRLDVDWPTPALSAATFIDTPGTSSLTPGVSARTESFLTDDDLPGADAIVFLTRRMEPEDLALLAGFQAATGGADRPTSTLTVLSRADEVGAGGVDALLSAQKIADRTAREPAVRAVTQDVLPVAGLVGLAGRTLRHGEFIALRSLATAPSADVETMLLSADRFRSSHPTVPLSPTMRAQLIDRLGMFGIRLSVALIRTGAGDVDTLADQLVRRSGLAELERLLSVHFTRRGAHLRAGAVLHAVERLLRTLPVSGSDRIWRELERIRVGSRDLLELDVLARLRSVDLGLPQPVRDEGERLLGAAGASPAERLALPDGTSAAELRDALLGAVVRWRGYADDPLARRLTTDTADAVVRACEALLAGMGDGADDAGRPAFAGPSAGASTRSGSGPDGVDPFT